MNNKKLSGHPFPRGFKPSMVSSHVISGEESPIFREIYEILIGVREFCWSKESQLGFRLQDLVKHPKKRNCNFETFSVVINSIMVVRFKGEIAGFALIQDDTLRLVLSRKYYSRKFHLAASMVAKFLAKDDFFSGDERRIMAQARRFSNDPTKFDGCILEIKLPKERVSDLDLKRSWSFQ